MILGVYRLAATVSGLMAPWILGRRAGMGKEDPTRLNERLGMAAGPRPPGPFLWIHAASVGESVSALGLMERLLARDAALHILITSGTVTSARLLKERLPPRVIHHYAPIDTPVAVRRFLSHWRPDLAVWLESELWPNLVLETRRFGTAMLLLNARMSQRSYQSWQRVPRTIRRLLSCFDFCLAQSEHEAERFQSLGVLKAHPMANLKWIAPPLPYCSQAATDLRISLRGRPLWLAASTHPGEEEMIAAAHSVLKADYADVLTIIVPRHPVRGPVIAQSLRQSGFAVACRSLGESLHADDDIYLADTLGELGLFYRLSEIAFIGGSLVAGGGHNPIEPAQLGCALVMGPHRENFTSVTTAFESEGGVRFVDNAEGLAAAVAGLLGDNAARQAAIAANRAVVAAHCHLLEPVIEQIAAYLPAASAVRRDASP